MAICFLFGDFSGTLKIVATRGSRKRRVFSQWELMPRNMYGLGCAEKATRERKVGSPSVLRELGREKSG